MSVADGFIRDWTHTMLKRVQEKRRAAAARGGFIDVTTHDDVQPPRSTRLYVGGLCVGDVLDLELPSITREHRFDPWCDGEDVYVVPPIKRMSNLIVHVARGDGYNGEPVRRAWETNSKANILIVMPTGETFAFQGFVREFSMATPYDGIAFTRITVMPSGPVLMGTQGKEEQMKVTKEQVKKNRFYVGSPDALRRGWGHESLQAATDHAADMIDKGQQGEEQFIVKIVRVVRKKKTPVTIEDVK